MKANVNLDEAARVAAEADQAKAELVSPFLEAAALVLWQECREQPVRGKVHRVRSPRTSDEVSALVALTGSVAGLVIYSMSSVTACALASKMMGEPVEELDPLAQSAIAELANVITGQASILLEQAGYP
ncbi:MAG: chemotaxis protein CheX, partial [Dehalococcoidia bacterium]|nr:chemotaxis protein CheX [Dehalococcoidia bacterium]